MTSYFWQGLSLFLTLHLFIFIFFTMMKRVILILTFFVTVFLSLFADGDPTAANINLQHKGHDDHLEYFPPADLPEAYYDSDNLEIILVADGFSSYYDVDIFQTGYTIPVITTQVDGYGDTIDISSLPDGNYTIVITSEFNNEFEGQFIVN